MVVGATDKYSCQSTLQKEQKRPQQKRGAQRLHLRFVEGTAEHAADEGGAEDEVWHGERMRSIPVTQRMRQSVAPCMRKSCTAYSGCTTPAQVGAVAHRRDIPLGSNFMASFANAFV